MIREENNETLIGIIERVTFHNEDSGFCVLRVKVRNHHDLVTMVGTVASVAPGENVEGLGAWCTDKQHGLQFKTQQLKVIPPTSLEGIEKYLGSGMVRGIGPHFAKKLVRAFGEEVFDVIENSPERLVKLDGIGEKRKKMVISAWAEQKSIRNIMVFLQSHGIGTARAVRIYKTYGEKSIEKVNENPYCLALDIHGIGFKTADVLAQKLGIAFDSLLRARAGVRHTLQQICKQGHCAAEYENLVATSVELLEIPDSIIRSAITLELEAKTQVIDTVKGVRYVFPAFLYHAELAIAAHLARLLRFKITWEMTIDNLIPWVEAQSALMLSTSQKEALVNLFQHKLAIITGGPGVGKTTLVKSAIMVLHAHKLSVSLCAPTGRAAKRLHETTGVQAKTIHRLLEFDPKNFKFKHDQDNPLALDVLIVDESSMLDTVLFYHLLKAVPNHAALFFVGDVDQLPSVGSGAVLGDMIRSKTFLTVKLIEIFRQGVGSQIILNAHRINQGMMPLPNADQKGDFFTIYVNTPEEIHEQVLTLVSERLPNYLKCSAIMHIQVLTPMTRGGLGSISLNIALQKKINPTAQPTITRFGTTFAPGDKVIQTVNNYDKEIFNGDIGYIAMIDLDQSFLNVLFDNRLVHYHFSELDELNLAYAITIHKSQGSEFPVVVIPISTQHYPLLARNLLYTAVTRGKQLVVLVGQRKAVSMAIGNNRENKRLTQLAERLMLIKEGK